MTLDEYLAFRFGPVFDVLNDAGGVPEELMECLKRGAIWRLAEKAEGRRQTDGAPWPRMSIHFNRMGRGYMSAFVNYKHIEPANLEDLFARVAGALPEEATA